MPGYPVKGVRVRLYDGSYHSVDSSEMAFKMAGSIAMKEALAQAGAVLLEPIMLVTLSVPDDASATSSATSTRAAAARRAWSPPGGMTEVKAEVPMAEMLTYAPDLRALTGGQGDYTMDFLRYEEIPAAPGAEGHQRGQGRGGGGQRLTRPRGEPPMRGGRRRRRATG